MPSFERAVLLQYVQLLSRAADAPPGEQPKQQLVVVLTALGDYLSLRQAEPRTGVLWRELLARLVALLERYKVKQELVNTDTLKLAVLHALQRLYPAGYSYTSSDADDVELRHRDGEVLPGLLAYAITTLLEFCASAAERNKQVRLAALQALHRLVVYYPGSLLAAYVPGVTSTLVAVVLGGRRQGKSVVVEALATLADFLVAALPRARPPSTGSDAHEQLAALARLANARTSVGQVVAVVDSHDDKLAAQLQRVYLLTQFDDTPAVRAALCQSAERLLRAVLPGAVCLLQRVALAACDDDDASVCDDARTALRRLDDDGYVAPLRAQLRDFARQLVTSLPRLLRTTVDDASQAQLIRMVRAHLLLLGAASVPLLFAAHAHAFAAAALTMFDLDVAATLHSRNARRVFVHLRGRAAQAEAARLAHALAAHCDVHPLLDYFLPLLATAASPDRLAAAHALAAIVARHPAVTFDVVDRLVHATVESSLTSSSTALAPAEQAPDAEQLGELFTALQLELLSAGLSALPPAAAIQPRQGRLGAASPAQQLLIRLLYPLVEALGSASVAISSAALAALDGLSRCCCDGQPVVDMIVANADYLLDTVAFRMRYLADYPATPRLLSTFARHVGLAALPLLRDTLAEVLNAIDRLFVDAPAALQTLPRHRAASEELCLGLLRVVLATAQMIAAAQPRVEQSPEAAAFAVPNRSVLETLLDRADVDRTAVATDIAQIGEYFRAYHAQREQDPSALHGDDQDTDSDEKTPPPLPHQEIVVQLLNKCANLLGLQSSRAVALVCQIVACCASVLAAAQPDRSTPGNVFLPCVHTLWDPLVCRLSRAVNAGDVGATQAIFAVLEQLAVHCRDFISAKFARDLWPRCCDVVAREAPRNLDVDTARYRAVHSRAHEFTPSFKLQAGLLRTLASLLGDGAVRLPAVDPLDVFKTVCPYLDDRQFVPLQRLAIDVVRRLCALDGDSLYAVVCALSDTPPPRSPSPQLLPELDPWPRQLVAQCIGQHVDKHRHHYTANARQVMQYL